VLQRCCVAPSRCHGASLSVQKLASEPGISDSEPHAVVKQRPNNLANLQIQQVLELYRAMQQMNCSHIMLSRKVDIQNPP